MSVYKAIMSHLFSAFVAGMNQNADVLDSHLSDKAKYARFTITASQSISSGTDAQIQWGNKTSYNGEDFCELDAGTGKIKILKTGMYQLMTTIAFAGNATGSRAYWGVVLNNNYPSNSTPCYMAVSEFIYATAGQLLNSRVIQSSGGSLDLIASGTGCMIRKVV